MAKKRISSVDLSWMIFERMRDEAVTPRGVSVAVVPDAKFGWRVILDGRGGKYLSRAAMRKLRSVENEIRSDFILARD
jgi:hypothetical protein